MKKLLVLMLVVAVGSIASAGMMLSGPAEAAEGEAFELVVSGMAADATGLGLAGGVYATPGAGGQTAGSAEALAAAGNLGSVGTYDDGFFNGWDFTVGALLPQDASEEVADGDWAVLRYVAGAAGTSETFGLYDYDVSYDDPIQTITVAYTPEPMSLALLGLGGLFLRRRK